ncbi:manganese/zinc/iron transport system permease protein [Bowdeniella nasicola]|uniref:Manganese/zinc/iron transport system permease protein n=1 Tax=Bowdeniella nasicola TaxID=208480 RepID=A0A1H3Y9B6_9ACTO|nr:metal ABC transporter permease [Bowdeniella nasicola]SEA08209.1 manganese/zinc/iron transport system permease protein [Bowdeniella nasicola]
MLSLADFLATHTFRQMVLGCTLIGALAGAMGCFIYLRQRTLMSDVIGHAATTGVMLAFLIGAAVLGVDGRSLWLLVIGSVLIGTLAAVLADRIAASTRVGIDAAMAVMLALFFGTGLILLRVIERSSLRGRGGLKDYFFGNASLLTTSDVRTIAVLAVLISVGLALGYRALAVHVIDPVAGSVAGVSARLVSPLLLVGVAIAVVVGVRAVGLILMVALAAIPPAAARQFTRHLHTMVALAAAIGAGGALIGSYLSVAFGKVPTGPVIVLVLTAALALSLLFAPGRSVLRRAAL